MVSGNPKSTGIPQVDGLSMGPSNLGCHRLDYGSTTKTYSVKRVKPFFLESVESTVESVKSIYNYFYF